MLLAIARNAAQEIDRRLDLRAQHGDDVTVGYEGDVFPVIRRVLGRIGM